MSREYTEYLQEHRENVREAVTWIIDHKILDPNFNITCNQILCRLHDASKDTPEEYVAYDRYFYGERTELVKKEFDYAWLHHIHNNPHHWQYWTLMEDDSNVVKSLEMPYEYAIEMVCDWWSFSWKKGNLYEIFDWYDEHKKYIYLHPTTQVFVEQLLKGIRTELDKTVKEYYQRTKTS